MRVTRHRTPRQGAGVGRLMKRTTVVAQPDDLLMTVAARMRSRRRGAALVKSGDELVGIATERDLLKAVADGRNPRETQISQYMTRNPITIDIGGGAADAAALMVQHRVRHLPVIEEGRLVGLVSARDLLALHLWPSDLRAAEPW